MMAFSGQPIIDLQLAESFTDLQVDDLTWCTIFVWSRFQALPKGTRVNSAFEFERVYLLVFGTKIQQNMLKAVRLHKCPSPVDIFCMIPKLVMTAVKHDNEKSMNIWWKNVNVSCFFSPLHLGKFIKQKKTATDSPTSSFRIIYTYHAKNGNKYL